VEIFFSFGRTFFFWLKFSNSWQNLYFLLAKLFSLGKTYIYSWILFLGKTYISFWLNFSNSWQILYFSLVKLFSLGKTYISSWQKISLLAKPIFLFG